MNLLLMTIPVSQRGVVFFRAQDNLTDALQKEFVHKLGLLSGKPKDSTLHIHHSPHAIGVSQWQSSFLCRSA